MTMTSELRTERRQLWPRGQSIDVRGEYAKMEVKAEGGDWRAPTEDEYRAVRCNQLADRYAEREIYCCDSCLVSDMMQNAHDLPSDFAREWDYDRVSNLTPDPSDWTLEECKEWLEDNGHDLPDPNPWEMDRAALWDALLDEDAGVNAERAAMDADELRAIYIEEVNDEFHEGLSDWREAVRDNAEPAEVYEWWRVSKWLAARLSEIGECVLDNAYGQWWGRCVTGQSYMMDGTLQKVAAQFVRKIGD